MLGNVSVINELIAEVTYHSGKEISVLQNAPIGTMEVLKCETVLVISNRFAYAVFHLMEKRTGDGKCIG